MKRLLLLLILSGLSSSVWSQMDSIRLSAIEEKYGEQWDFCTCVVKNDSIHSALLVPYLSEEEIDRISVRSGQVEKKCMAFLAMFPLSTPDERTLHKKRVKDCLDRNETRNKIHIAFVDAVSRAPISQLTFLISIASDTLVFHEVPNGTLDLNLDQVGTYNATVIKEGYDTLQLAFENSAEATEHILEFFLPRSDLTKEEKKVAHEHSVNLPDRSSERDGGFQKITASKREFIVLRYRAFLDGSSVETFESRKIRTSKSSKKSKRTVHKELNDFLDIFGNALLEKDTAWIKQHTDQEVFTFLSDRTKGFRSEETIELKRRIDMKRRYNLLSRDRYGITFGKYSETTDYPGGAMRLEKIGGQWCISKYKLRK